MAAADKTEASKRIVEETRRLYAAVLARAPDEKQLARPAFKLIQDLVRSLVAETRILRDVFTPADLSAGAARTWDRRAKVDFVQRLIDYAANNKQPVVGCAAAKVVAGAQPNKTNELLQSLARLAQLKLSGRRPPSDERRPRTFTKPVSAAGPPSSSPPAQQGDAGGGGGTSPAQQQQQRRRRSPQSAGQQLGQAEAKTGRTPTATRTRAAGGDNNSNEAPGGRGSLVRAPGEQAAPAPPASSSHATLRRPQRQQPRADLPPASEADIGRGAQRLRVGLARVRALMAELSGTEDLLRESLQRALGRLEAS